MKRQRKTSFRQETSCLMKWWGRNKLRNIKISAATWTLTRVFTIILLKWIQFQIKIFTANRLCHSRFQIQGHKLVTLPKQNLLEISNMSLVQSPSPTILLNKLVSKCPYQQKFKILILLGCGMLLKLNQNLHKLNLFFPESRPQFMLNNLRNMFNLNLNMLCKARIHFQFMPSNLYVLVLQVVLTNLCWWSCSGKSSTPLNNYGALSPN